MPPKLGILLINTGTPDAPTSSAVRHYLREFLSDKRVVHLSRLIWWPILYGIILNKRPQASAKLYQKIWMPAGSPMRVIMQTLCERLQQTIHQHHHTNVIVAMGMNYGTPSIPHALERLQQQQVDDIIVLPLFPQYSDTTTASSFDRVQQALKKWSVPPKLRKINDYYADPNYICALAASYRAHHPSAEHLLISFHGIPERYTQLGDPYATQCEETARLLATELQLPATKWTLCYQSRFGYSKWLQPFTQTILSELPPRGIKTVDVICPGFAIDCLETLEEINIRGKELFLKSGGISLNYISALNDNNAHVDVLAKLLFDNIAK